MADPQTRRLVGSLVGRPEGAKVQVQRRGLVHETIGFLRVEEDKPPGRALGDRLVADLVVAAGRAAGEVHASHDPVDLQGGEGRSQSIGVGRGRPGLLFGPPRVPHLADQHCDGLGGRRDVLVVHVVGRELGEQFDGLVDG